MIRNAILILVLVTLAFVAKAATPLDIRLNSLYSALSDCEFTVTSGKRTVEHNRRVGGAPNSYHLTDRARDITSTKECRARLGHLALEEGLSVIYYPSHIHIDDRGYQITFTKDK